MDEGKLAACRHPTEHGADESQGHARGYADSPREQDHADGCQRDEDVIRLSLAAEVDHVRAHRLGYSGANHHRADCAEQKERCSNSGADEASGREGRHEVAAVVEAGDEPEQARCGQRGHRREAHHYERPTISPLSSMSMRMALGWEGSPGMVRMSPQIG